MGTFKALLHSRISRVAAWLLILTLPLYGLPVHALAPTSPASESQVQEEVGRVPRAIEPLQALTEPAPASLLHVNNTDSTCHNHQPCFTTIQAAIDAVQPGQTIRIQAGEYDEAIRIKGKNNSPDASEAGRIVIEADPDAAPGSVILGSASQKCTKGDAIQIESSKFITLRGLTITDTGGQAIQLFGGRRKQNTAIQIERNRIYGNGTTRCQGGILIGSGNPDTLIVNNLIYGNGQEGIKIVGLKGGPH
jgi:hypothetical protein